MNVTRLEERESWILDKLGLKVGTRLPGKHVTDAIWCNIKAFGQARLETAGHDMPSHDTGSLIRMCLGIGLADIIEEGEVSQIQAVTTADDSVGTLDVYWRGHPCEIKVTWQSSRKQPSDNPYWLEQLGDYTYRTMKPDAKTGYAEFWVVHLGGDQGKKLCPEHGVPEERITAVYPETGSRRLICPECREFLQDGNRNPCIRCWGWRDERWAFQAYHDMHVERLAQLEADIKNPAFQLGGELPPGRWGYWDIECKGCHVKDRIGCPGMGESIDLAESLEGSINELRKEQASA